MDFKIEALSETAFSHLFELTDAELVEHHACRQVVTEKPGTPCRVSMADAEIGDAVILLNFEHQPKNSPYKAGHAIFVREGAKQAKIAINEVPDVIRTRLMSVRFFDSNHMMVDADVVPGEKVSGVISAAFDVDEIAYIHLHNAKPGCFAAVVNRAQ
ncbi:MAG: DUF1203 domain-containing protein [Pseudomonadota bacterium]